MYKSYCLILVQNLKLPCLCKLDWQAIQLSLFFHHSLKDQVKNSRNILSYAWIVNSALDKSSIFFAFKFALLKSQAVLSLAGDFPTLLNDVTESPSFTSSPIFLCILNLCLGIQFFFQIFSFLGFGSLTLYFLTIIVFFFTFAPTISSGLLPWQVCSLLPLHFLILPYMVF